MITILWIYVISSLLFQIIYRWFYKTDKKGFEESSGPMNPFLLINFGSLLPIFNTGAVVISLFAMGKDFIAGLFKKGSKGIGIPMEVKGGDVPTAYIIQDERIDTNLVSDGYHTFGELYDHRITLWIALCKQISSDERCTMPWRTKLHSDGSEWSGWFILGYGDLKGEQITYHLPIDRWEECDFAYDMKKAPEYDGHTPADVLERIKNI